MLLLLAWVSVAIGMAWHLRAQLRTFRDCILSQPGLFMIAGGFFVIAGSLFDSQIINVSQYAFYEELAELDGHFLILQSSLAALCGLKSTSIAAHQQLEAHLS